MFGTSNSVQIPVGAHARGAGDGARCSTARRSRGAPVTSSPTCCCGPIPTRSSISATASPGRSARCTRPTAPAGRPIRATRSSPLLADAGDVVDGSPSAPSSSSTCSTSRAPRSTPPATSTSPRVPGASSCAARRSASSRAASPSTPGTTRPGPGQYELDLAAARRRCDLADAIVLTKQLVRELRAIAGLRGDVHAAAVRGSARVGPPPAPAHARACSSTTRRPRASRAAASSPASWPTPGRSCAHRRADGELLQAAARRARGPERDRVGPHEPRRARAGQLVPGRRRVDRVPRRRPVGEPLPAARRA